MNTFNRKDINLNELRNHAIYLLEAGGFEVVRRSIPAIMVCAEAENPYYLMDSHTIVLTEKIANGPVDRIERTLVHELAHSVQPSDILGFNFMPYHMRECEKQAYYVQYMYELRQKTTKCFLGGMWNFLERYGKRSWFEEQYKVTCEAMRDNITILNHMDLDSSLTKICEEVIGSSNPYLAK